MCEGPFGALSLLAAGVPRVVALSGVQGWACEAALRGKRVAVLPPAAYGGYKDASAAWVAGVLAVGDGPAAADAEKWESPETLLELWEERTAIRVYDGRLLPTEAARLADASLLPPGEAR